MTRAETILVLSASTAGAIFAAVRMASAGGSPLLVALTALIGFDVIGGAVCNATRTTRAWYHRPGQGWREHLTFVAPHLIYIVVVATIARGPNFDSTFAIVLGLGLVAASVLLIGAPVRLKSPLAFSAFLTLLIGVTLVSGPTPGLEWFTPALLLKLLLGNLVPDLGAPFTINPNGLKAHSESRDEIQTETLPVDFEG